MEEDKNWKENVLNFVSGTLNGLDLSRFRIMKSQHAFKNPKGGFQQIYQVMSFLTLYSLVIMISIMHMRTYLYKKISSTIHINPY